MTQLAKDQEDKLELLYPPFADTVRGFLVDAHSKGMNVGIFEGLRTYERQKELWLKGRNEKGQVIDRTKIVTKAQPGMSYHQYGLAVDIVFDADATRPGWQWSWDGKWPWKKLADLGRTHGLEAAYYWKAFPEAPHYQKTWGFKINELLSMYLDGGLPHVWDEIDRILRKGI